MDWTTAIDGYCERTELGLWAEPLNLVTNAAFLVAALVMARRCRGTARGQWLPAVLFLIGIGSALFHSVATAWASLADVLPIAVFIVLYLWFANRDFLGQGRVAAIVTTAIGFGVVLVAARALGALLPGLGANASYLSVALLILVYGLALARRAQGRATGTGLLVGAGMLGVSIGFRMLDTPLCGRWPWGTHFIWHLLNAAMLGWMIEVWRRHKLEGARAGR